jgi:hypothetical protein
MILDPAAVCVLATLHRALKYDCIVCIKQLRPPLGACTLEFPAGILQYFNQ